jgi:hypothetical protein
MLIAQMTDIHIGFAPGEKPEELNRIRFRATLKRLVEGPNRPDMLVLSGDITDNGDLDSFEKTAELLTDCPFPVWPMVGNHDTREALVEAFPQVSLDGGFLHYVVEDEGLRIVMLDTLQNGRHGGAFCEARAAWLSAQLDAAPRTPTVIFMHHPPVVSGIEWMDPAPGNPLRPSAPPARGELSRHPAPRDAVGRAAGGDGLAPDRQARPRRPRPDHYRGAELRAAPLGRARPRYALRTGQRLEGHRALHRQPAGDDPGHVRRARVIH